jgi:hypothetical protein
VFQLQILLIQKYVFIIATAGSSITIMLVWLGGPELSREHDDASSFFFDKDDASSLKTS